MGRWGGWGGWGDGEMGMFVVTTSVVAVEAIRESPLHFCRVHLSAEVWTGED